MKKNLYSLLYLVPSLFWGQEISITLLDSLYGEPIPFATIQTNFNQNTITNEEGLFRLKLNEQQHSNDSIFISCMGFNPYREAVDRLPKTTILLSEKDIALEGIIVSQNMLSAEEIIKKTTQNLQDKYALNLTEKIFFMRESFGQEWEKRKISIKKNSIPELNQKFWDSIMMSIPKKDQWHTETAGRWYSEWKKTPQKLIIDRAVNLEDTINTKGYDQISEKITRVLEHEVKEKSYFKFKTGILSTKVDREEIINQIQDSTSSDSVQKNAKRFHSARKKKLSNVLGSLYNKETLNISILQKFKEYEFKLVAYTYMQDTPVYTIDFKPKTRKGEYKGRMYIDGDLFALMEIRYKNTKDLKNFSLLGLSFQAYGRSVHMKFNRFNQLRYQLQFLETKFNYRFGIDRPMKVIEKNKFVRGRRKQNELSGRVDFQLNQEERFTLVIFESQPTERNTFESQKENTTYIPTKLHSFDPLFWEGYKVIAPNTAIRSFDVQEKNK